jgi:hypothetical protein
MTAHAAPPRVPPPNDPQTNNKVFLPALAAGAVVAAAFGLAASISRIQTGKPAEHAVMLTGILISAILVAVPGAYLLAKGRDARPGAAGLAFLSACAVSLVGIYLFWVSSYVFFPADMLIWSEGDFVNDIIKFTVGYPMYSPQVNNDSINYVPGAQLLTYFLACLVGKSGSIPVYRVIQVIYAAIAAFLGTLCTRRILRLAFPHSREGQSWMWNIFWFAALLLVATNSITNHFAHNLHADALAEVANVGAFYLLLCYIEKRSWSLLAAMAAMGTVGFFIRQNALIWAPLYAGFLLVWDRDWKRLGVFIAAAGAIYGAAIAACFALWGEPFYYWVFYMLTKHAIAPLRSFQHALDAWAYFAALLLGAAAILRGRNSGKLFGAWLSCLVVLATATYTSGLGWMLNHMGPGSLLAGVWFVAGLASVWNPATESGGSFGMERWIRTATIVGTICLMFSGLGFIRIPLRPIPSDAYRYVHDIEKQFDRAPAQKILLDLGSWTYWKDRAIVGDRATSVGDRGYSGAGDFSGLLSRIATKHYSLILVHGYHNFDFVYDYFLFPKPTGIRKALQDNYRETGSIRAVENNPYVKDWAEDPFYFGEITILEPRTN